jgi:hypothetical protein
MTRPPAATDALMKLRCCLCSSRAMAAKNLLVRPKWIQGMLTRADLSSDPFLAILTSLYLTPYRVWETIVIVIVTVDFRECPWPRPVVGP